MKFLSLAQEKQMLSDVEKVEACLADPDSPLYGSNIVMWVADLCCHVKALLAEVELLRSTIDEVQEKRIEATIEGTEWKGKAMQLGRRLAKYELDLNRKCET